MVWYSAVLDGGWPHNYKFGFDRTVDRQWIQSEGETHASTGNRA